MIKIEDFFTVIKIDEDLSTKDYEVVSSYIKVINAFTRTSYQSAYLIDYQSRGFLFVSDNPIFLCGYSAEDVKEAGYGFYLRQVPKEDLELLLDINYAGFQFYEKLSISDRLSYSITYDFHLKQKDDSLMLVNHTLTPLEVRDKGQIWLALCLVSVSSNSQSGNIYISSKEKKEQFAYNRMSKKWIRKDWIQLNDKEKKILMLSAQGFTNEDISSIVYASIDTVKLYKRKIFDKLDAKNIMEAMSTAITRNLF